MFEMFKTMFVACSTLAVGDYFIKDDDSKDKRKHNMYQPRHSVVPIGAPPNNQNKQKPQHSKNCVLEFYNYGKPFYLVDGKLMLEGKEYVVIPLEEYINLCQTARKNEDEEILV